jgi:hypothetical protein
MDAVSGVSIKSSLPGAAVRRAMSLPLANVRQSIVFEAMDTRVKPAWALVLLRLPLLDRPAGVAPGGEVAAHMRDWPQAHVLRGLAASTERMPPAQWKMNFVLLEASGRRGLRIRTPACRECRERAGNFPVALDLPSDVDDDDIGACAALMASAALTVSISALASSIKDLVPR